MGTRKSERDLWALSGMTIAATSRRWPASPGCVVSPLPPDGRNTWRGCCR